MPKTHPQFLPAVGVMILCYESKQAMCRYKYGTMRYDTVPYGTLVNDDSRVRQRTVWDGRNSYF